LVSFAVALPSVANRTNLISMVDLMKLLLAAQPSGSTCAVVAQQTQMPLSIHLFLVEIQILPVHAVLVAHAL
jgi:hypothetical protein